MVADPSLSMVGTVTYYAVSHIGATGCESTSRTPVTLTIHPSPSNNCFQYHRTYYVLGAQME